MASDKSSNDDRISENEIYKFLTAHWHHHNQLAWSKLYVLLALQASTLAGAYQLHDIDALKPASFGLLIVGLVVAALLYLLMQRDWEIRDYVAKKLDRVHREHDIEVLPQPNRMLVKGSTLLKTLMVVLVITNFAAAFVMNV